MVAKSKLADEEAPALSLRDRNRLRTRRELLDAALSVFAESGYGSATVENIAARAGASKVTLYNYFPQGREELFRDLYEEINAELIDKALAIYAGEGDLSSRIVAVTEAVVEIAQRPLIGRFYSIDDPALDEALDPVRGHASRVLAELICGDFAASTSARSNKEKARAAAVGELIVGSMRAALTAVAQERFRPQDMTTAMRALVAGL